MGHREVHEAAFERRVEEALRKPFQGRLHPRDREGKFRRTFRSHAPDRREVTRPERRSADADVWSTRRGPPGAMSPGETDPGHEDDSGVRFPAVKGGEWYGSNGRYTLRGAKSGNVYGEVWNEGPFYWLASFQGRSLNLRGHGPSGEEDPETDPFESLDEALGMLAESFEGHMDLVRARKAEREKSKPPVAQDVSYPGGAGRAARSDQGSSVTPKGGIVSELSSAEKSLLRGVDEWETRPGKFGHDRSSLKGISEDGLRSMRAKVAGTRIHQSATAGPDSGHARRTAAKETLLEKIDAALPKSATPDAAPKGAGAVVGGKPGRWVPVMGKQTHIPFNEAWQAQGSDGVLLTSPALSTEIFRGGVLVSAPGKKALHADVLRAGKAEKPPLPPLRTVSDPRLEPLALRPLRTVSDPRLEPLASEAPKTPAKGNTYVLFVGNDGTEHTVKASSPASALQILAAQAGLNLDTQNGRYGRTADGKQVSAMLVSGGRKTYPSNNPLSPNYKPSEAEAVKDQPRAPRPRKGQASPPFGGSESRPDTPSQKRTLRQSKTARKVRAMYPEGTRVTAAGHETGLDGTVVRHVPGLNAQGGHLVVRWDNGSEGRHSAISLRKVDGAASPGESDDARTYAKVRRIKNESSEHIDTGTSQGYLQAVDNFVSQQFPQDGTFEYRSRQDFMLREGQQFEMKDPPPEAVLGEMGLCYMNAYQVVSANPGRFRYVEGVAMSIIPVDHAWVYDTEDGKAFDVTWRDKGGREKPDYFGVIFPTQTLFETTLEKGTYGVLDHVDLYRHPFVRDLDLPPRLTPRQRDQMASPGETTVRPLRGSVARARRQRARMERRAEGIRDPQERRQVQMQAEKERSWTAYLAGLRAARRARAGLDARRA